jgi:hypothetical protein
MNEKYQSMVKLCFGGDSLFERSRHSAFEQFLNNLVNTGDKVSMSEVLAIYTDGILRKGGMKAVQEVTNEEEYLKQIV